VGPRLEHIIVSAVIVYAVVDESLSPTSPLGDTFVRREDAERFIARVKRDDPQLAADLRVVERELEAGGATDRTGCFDT
jgi:hypothetical protein